jgi:acyl carrier protein
VFITFWPPAKKDPGMDVAARCIELVADTKKVPASSITLETTLESLGIDSLDKINIGFAVEEEYGIEIPDASLNELRSVGDIVHGVERLRAKAAAEPAAS